MSSIFSKYFSKTKREKEEGYILQAVPKESIFFLDLESCSNLSKRFCSALQEFNYLNNIPDIDRRIHIFTSFVHPAEITFEGKKNVIILPNQNSALAVSSNKIVQFYCDCIKDYVEDYSTIEVSYRVIMYPSKEYLLKLEKLSGDEYRKVGFMDLEKICLGGYNRTFKLIN